MDIYDRTKIIIIFFLWSNFRLLQRVYNLEEDEPHALDPYSDDNKAPFYRQPAGVRRAKKHEVKEEMGEWKITQTQMSFLQLLNIAIIIT